MSSFLNFINLLGRQTATQSTIDVKLRNGVSSADNASVSQAIFPSDLFTAANEAYILFIKRNPTIRGELSADTKTAARMALYMPPTIKVNYGTSWEELSMSIYQYADNAKEVSRLAELATSGRDGAMAEAADILARMGTSGAVNVLDYVASGSTFGQQLEWFRQKTVNPHMALLFRGVQFRTFQFDFQLMARSADESDSIANIIKSFKAGMHPSIDGGEGGSGKFWVYPDNFDIFLSTGVQGPGEASPYLFQISTAVLTDMSVDYAGSGIPSFFYANGAPVDIKMSLTFKELGVLTREKVHEGY